ncbi:MAG: hypothetical protein HOH43_04180 [Candidatus Latescibacteria bacterium]|jgi:hypothetical protein|nr:hypothetical protein [Candidatus Latescibacterota bacterium]
MRILLLFLLVPSILATAPDLHAQQEESDLRIFGYFQSSFQHWTKESGIPDGFQTDRAKNFFTAQQLNLFLQKDLAKNWRSFVNFEALNNLSTGKQWGSYSLEEAWARYRYDERFNLKLGLQIPIFNHLNEIKNRTPLLPYVIRPLVYEASFDEFIAVRQFTPTHAFVQAYGFLSAGATKLDYAVYLGNSPNINGSPGLGPTGVDTSATVMVGGRVGLRHKELKLGISGTFDKTNILQGLQSFASVGGGKDRFREINRYRLGGDLSYHISGLSLESEFIVLRYDDGVSGVSIDGEFIYGTLGYSLKDMWYLYGGYWFLEEDDLLTDAASPGQIFGALGKSGVINGGFSFSPNERVTFKGQLARVDFTRVVPAINLKFHSHFYHISTAVSVFF